MTRSRRYNSGLRMLASGHSSEDAEQISLFEWLALTRWRGEPLARWYFAIPNGGFRHALEAMRLKRMGVKAGVHDVFGAIAASGYHGHFVELKAHGGSVRPEQRDFAELVRGEGFRVDVCFGWYEAKTAIERYLGPASALQERGGG